MDKPIFSLILTITLRSSYYFLHFINEETESQGRGREQKENSLLLRLLETWLVIALTPLQISQPDLYPTKIVNVVTES